MSLLYRVLVGITPFQCKFAVQQKGGVEHVLHIHAILHDPDMYHSNSAQAAKSYYMCFAVNLDFHL